MYQSFFLLPGYWIFFYPNFFLWLDPVSFLRLFSFDPFYQYIIFFNFSAF